MFVLLLSTFSGQLTGNINGIENPVENIYEMAKTEKIFLTVGGSDLRVKVCVHMYIL